MYYAVLITAQLHSDLRSYLTFCIISLMLHGPSFVSQGWIHLSKADGAALKTCLPHYTIPSPCLCVTASCILRDSSCCSACFPAYLKTSLLSERHAQSDEIPAFTQEAETMNLVSLTLWLSVSPSLVCRISPPNFSPRQQIFLFQETHTSAAVKTLKLGSETCWQNCAERLTGRSTHLLVWCQSWQPVRSKLQRIRRSKEAPTFMHKHAIKSISWQRSSSNKTLRACTHVHANTYTHSWVFSSEKKTGNRVDSILVMHCT